jgi:peptidoglycan hydrolase CwlO-like protein
MTEQEVITKLNELIAGNNLKENTAKFVNKIKTLDNQLVSLQNEVKTATDKIKGIETEMIRIRGAISALIELAAEEEGLLAPPEAPPATPSTPT